MNLLISGLNRLFSGESSTYPKFFPEEDGTVSMAERRRDNGKLDDYNSDKEQIEVSEESTESTDEKVQDTPWSN